MYESQKCGRSPAGCSAPRSVRCRHGEGRKGHADPVDQSGIRSCRRTSIWKSKPTRVRQGLNAIAGPRARTWRTWSRRDQGLTRRARARRRGFIAPPSSEELTLTLGIHLSTMRFRTASPSKRRARRDRRQGIDRQRVGQTAAEIRDFRSRSVQGQGVSTQMKKIC